mgnify:CR=1 FL=1|jgi:hypothetical protein
MKKLSLFLCALAISGATFACDGGKGEKCKKGEKKECCAKGAKEGKACCKNGGKDCKKACSKDAKTDEKKTDEKKS